MNVSDESHEGWIKYAEEAGVSLAVLFEVMGKHLHGAFRIEVERRMLAEARAETAARRRHGGPRRRPGPEAPPSA